MPLGSSENFPVLVTSFVPMWIEMYSVPDKEIKDSMETPFINLNVIIAVDSSGTCKYYS